MTRRCTAGATIGLVLCLGHATSGQSIGRLTLPHPIDPETPTDAPGHLARRPTTVDQHESSGAPPGYLAGAAAACDPHICGGEGGLVRAGGAVHGASFKALGGFAVSQIAHSRRGRMLYARPSP